MKNIARKFLCLLIFLPFLSKAQNLPQCDSLAITCCTYDSLGPNTITIYAANHSTELFPYPGFVLFDTAMDTIAKETVNYFGIGTYPQPHTMTILSPLTLPFTGYLNLYTLFYESLDCSFPFTIDDTATTVVEPSKADEIILFPNPCTDELHVTFSGSSVNSDVLLSIIDVAGKEVSVPVKMQLPTVLPMHQLEPGLYFFRMTVVNNQFSQFQKVVVGK